MNVGALVRVVSTLWRHGEIGVVIKQWPPEPMQDTDGLTKVGVYVFGSVLG